MSYENGVAVIIVMMCILVLFMLAAAVYRSRCKSSYIRETLLILIIPVYQLILVLCFFFACLERTFSVLLFGMMMVVFSWAIDIVVVQSLDKLEEKRQLEKRLAQLYVQRQTELDYYELNRTNVEKMKRVKAELLEQLSEAESLIETRKGFTEVRTVLDEAYQKMKRTQIYRFSDNPLLNSILSMKVKCAAEKGINPEINVHVDKDIELDPMDLCSLFCNLIDNAIEACERMESTSQKRFFSVKADYRQGCLVLRVANSSEGALHRSGERLVTQKNNREEHGLGIKLVERIVDKYQGKFYLMEQENTVVVDVILNLAENNYEAHQPELLRGFC